MVGTFIFAAIGAIFYCVRDGYVEASNLYVPMKLRSAIPVSDVQNFVCQFEFQFFVTIRTPFEIGTAGGWLRNIFYCFSLGLPYASLNISISSFFLSQGLFFEAFYLHFQSVFKDLDEIVGSKQTFARRTDLECKLAVIEAIQLHSNAKT